MDAYGAREYEAPEGETEAKLAAIWGEVLKVERVGRHDNFFELGGHSLLVIQLLSRIQESLGWDISVAAFFEAPTVAKLAARNPTKSGASPFDTVLPIRTNGTLPPLFAIHPGGGLSWCYIGLVKYLEPDRPVYGLQARNFTLSEMPTQSAEEMALNYIDQVQRLQPRGPYHLTGFSFGGLLAYIIASLLEQRGEKVAFLSIIDFIPHAGQESRDSGCEESNVGHNEQDVDEATVSNLLRRYYAFHDPYNYLGRDDRLLQQACGQKLNVVTKNLEISRRLAKQFRPRIYNGNLLVFISTASERSLESASEAWKPFVSGDVCVYPVTCAHIEMMNEQPLRQIGPIVGSQLSKLTKHTESVKSEAI